MTFLTLSVSRAREGGLFVSLRYSYKGKPPSRRERIVMSQKILSEALERLGGGGVADLGFQEDAQRRVRTDRMET